MNGSTRSALLRASIDVENAALMLGDDDDTLLTGEARQIRTIIAKLNSLAIQMQNLVNGADIRRRRAR